MTLMTRQEQIEIIRKELQRQANENRSQAPYIYDDTETTISIDGEIDLGLVVDVLKETER